MKRLFVVMNIDTEGPVTDERHPDLLNSWKGIDKSLEKIFSNSFRKKFSDSFREPVKFNWFIMDWAGFKTNPVKRDFGYHKIFDHYNEKFGKKISLFGDGVYWHYHHPSKSGIGNEWNPEWKGNKEYENILCRAVIERNFFPSVFRSGGTIESNAVSEWLEQWIPFDYSSRARAKDDSFGMDWSKAPDDWSIYNPNRADYQVRGEMKRAIARSLDISGKYHETEKAEITKAFERAKNGRETCLSYFYHDYRDLETAFAPVLEKIFETAKKFPEVRVENKNALEAIQACLGIENPQSLEFESEIKNQALEIRASPSIFGEQPFFAVKFKGNDFRRLDLEKNGKNSWRIGLENLAESEKIGIAANTPAGETGIKIVRI